MTLLKPTPPSSPREWRLPRSPHSCSRPRPRVLAPCIGLWTSWSSGTKPYEYRWPTSRRSRAGWRVSKPRCVSTRRVISSSCLSCIKLRSPVGPQHPTSGSSTPRRERLTQPRPRPRQRGARRPARAHARHRRGILARVLRPRRSGGRPTMDGESLLGSRQSPQPILDRVLHRHERRGCG